MAVVAALLAVPLGVSAASDHDDSQQATAGEQLGGAVGIQAAAVEGELDDRTFGQQIANAASDADRADLIDERLNETESRIADHEHRIAELQQQREAGEISEGRYQAQLGRLEAETANTERTLERANDSARGLPADVLAERDIGADRVDEIRRNASQLGGAETSEAAREIAGENVTQPIGGEHPGDTRAGGDRQDADNRSEPGSSSAEDDQPSDDQRANSGHDRSDNNQADDSDDTAHQQDDTARDDRTEHSDDDEHTGSNTDERSGR